MGEHGAASSPRQEPRMQGIHHRAWPGASARDCGASAQHVLDSGRAKRLRPQAAALRRDGAASTGLRETRSANSLSEQANARASTARAEGRSVPSRRHPGSRPAGPRAPLRDVRNHERPRKRAGEAARQASESAAATAFSQARPAEQSHADSRRCVARAPGVDNDSASASWVTCSSVSSQSRPMQVRPLWKLSLDA